MDNLINRREIAENVYFSSVTDKRFKLNKVSVTFVTGLSEETAALNALVPCLLSKCNDNFRTIAALNKKLSGLYAANLDCSVRKDGDLQYTGLYVTVIDNAFALENEDIMTEAVNLLKDCIFKPFLENGAFPKNSVEIEKQNQIDDNNAEINDKTLYSLKKAYTAAFKGEPAETGCLGENSDIEKITPKTAVTQYEKLLRDLRVEIVCVGCNDFIETEKILKKAFLSVKREVKHSPENRISPIKPEPLRITERLDVEQSKLVIVFKSEYRNKPALMVMSALYGGGEFAKLFKVVREEMSLCYYCFSRLGYSKGVMTAECGVDHNNLDKAEKECISQLDEIVKGNFSEEDIEKTKLSLINSLRSVNDGVSSVSNWYFSRIIDNDIITPEEMVNRINAVTKEEIIKAADSMKADTVYVLTSDKKEGEV